MAFVHMQLSYKAVRQRNRIPALFNHQGSRLQSLPKIYKLLHGDFRLPLLTNKSTAPLDGQGKVLRADLPDANLRLQGNISLPKLLISCRKLRQMLH